MEKTKEKQTPGQLEANYDKYVAQFRTLIESSQFKGREALDTAMATARDNLVFLGEISNEQGKLFGDYLKRDLAQTSKDMAELGEEARERLHPSRLGAGALAATAEVFRLIGHGLLNLSDKTNESITYHAGEITSAGTLTCLKCGDKVQLKKTSLIEACPACSGTIYKKGY
jgi:hypothetical protein